MVPQMSPTRPDSCSRAVSRLSEPPMMFSEIHGPVFPRYFTYPTDNCDNTITQTVTENNSITVPGDVEIHGASYGGLDVTQLLRQKHNAGERTFVGSNGVWTDPWPGMPKTFTVSCRKCFGDKTVTAREGGAVTLP